MQIDVFDDFDALAGLREDWQAVYASDPEAHFFLSWTWMANGLRGAKATWLVLAARPSGASRYVAFLPLRLRSKSKGDDGFFNEIVLGPMRLGDYQGLICEPDFIDGAISAFARHLGTLRWTHLILENLLLSDRRADLLRQPFRGGEFTTREVQNIDRVSAVNHHVCPYVELPGDWEAYLGSGPGSNTRQKIRRFLKKVDAGEFRVTHADAGTIERDIKILMEFWAAKWTERKGTHTQSIVKATSSMLRRCFRDGAAFVPVLWQDDRPLGALGCLTDRVKGSLLFLIAGRDESFASPPPGFILHAYTLRYAIGQGFTTYDLLRGNEPYKYQFGPKERRLKSYVITTRSGRNLGGTLDRRSLPDVFQQTLSLHKAGRLKAAENGYRQILAADPRHTAALYGLGQVLASTGAHGAAIEAFEAMLAIKPQFEKAWFRMGRSLWAQGDVAGAESSLRKAVALQPDYPDALALLARIGFSAAGAARSPAEAAP